MTTLASTHSGSLDTTSRARTVVGGLAVATLVPVLALAGLAIPLPSSVYRLAADLAERADVLAVGFGADRAPSDAKRPSSAIELAPAESSVAGTTISRPPAPVVESRAAPSERRRAAAVLPGGRPASNAPRAVGEPHPPAAPAGAERGAPATKPSPATTPTDAAAPASQPTGGAASPPADTKASAPAPSTDPAPTPAPAPSPSLGDTVEGAVGTATETVDGTVGTVQGTVEETVGTVEQTVGETVETVEDVVETLPLPLLPPKPPKPSTQLP
jgi:hypothetical protein